METDMRSYNAIAIWIVASIFAFGCSHTDEPDREGSEQGTRAESESPSARFKGSSGKHDASSEAVFLDFSFEGSLLTDSAHNREKRIEDQLLYTVGELNGDNSVGRVDKLELSDIETRDRGDKTEISYRAEMLVAWGEPDDVPETYTFHLPRDFSREGKREFVDNYGDECVSYSAHDVDANSMWYYYRPASRGCDLSEEHLVQPTAELAPSEVETSGKYPEYHRIWEDDLLKITAVFGKYESGATGSDSGISAYNKFVATMERTLEEGDLETTPENLPSRPGVDVPEVTFAAEYDDGRRIEIHAFLVDGVRSASQEFYDQYAELTKDSDLIAYNGHSGLGSNIRAMARRGEWREGQYSIIFMNGCDTYAYVDSALADAHARVNPDDETGTKYMDLVMNAMPSYFSSMADATEAFVDGLMRRDDPVTYEHIFEDIDDSQVVLVSGEQDNEFVPGMDDTDGDAPVGDWSGLETEVSLDRGGEERIETPTLPAGEYRFDLTGSGDADLYVRAGGAPDRETWDCRPYRAGSDESCTLDLASPAPVHVLLVGAADSSEVTLEAASME